MNSVGFLGVLAIDVRGGWSKGTVVSIKGCLTTNYMHLWNQNVVNVLKDNEVVTDFFHLELYSIASCSLSRLITTGFGPSDSSVQWLSLEGSIVLSYLIVTIALVVDVPCPGKRGLFDGKVTSSACSLVCAHNVSE